MIEVLEGPSIGHFSKTIKHSCCLICRRCNTSVLGHTEDQRLDRGIYTRTSWIGTMLRAVELTGNQTTIPGQNGIWLGNTGYLRQMFPAQALGDPSEGKPFRVGKP